MIVAIRLVVHKSVLYPHASAPRRSKLGNFFTCPAESFQGRPEAGLARNPFGPFCRTVFRQKITEL
jgi:hypothetical protein